MFRYFSSQPAFRHRVFRTYLIQRILTTCIMQIFTVAISQYIYETTKNPLYLGYVGLALFLPKFFFLPISGFVADRIDRRQIMLWARAGRALVAVLMAFCLFSAAPLSFIYLFLVIQGSINAFDGPAAQAYVPHLVPRDDFSNAATWNSFFFQSGTVVGPVLGGWLYSLLSASWLFVAVFFLSCVAWVLMQRIHVRTPINKEAKLNMPHLLAGLHYVVKQRILFGAISLDLFAVLFGGVVALLPIYANDILQVGASGLGYLRAAPGLGAILMAALLAHLPRRYQNGKTMLICVALFGIFTIAFALSTHFWWSLLFLFCLGAVDMVSVVLRGIMVQLETPDALRGRVSAVNTIFIGASNELGEFESGLTARILGVVPAAVLGGVLTLTVVGLWKYYFPELWHYQEQEKSPV